MKEEIKLFKFIEFLDKLKNEKRFGGVKKIKADNSADHSWRLALMLVLLSDFYNIKVNLLKAIKIALVHDLVEIYAKDIPRSKRFKNNISKEEKLKEEKRAMIRIKKLAPKLIGEEISDLWKEYADHKTKEAKITASLDKIEGLMTFFNRGGIPAKYYKDYAATYANKYVKETPELLSFYKILQKEMEKSYKKNNLKWEKKYSISSPLGE
jgi:putative hydrolase of HD superfamily